MKRTNTAYLLAILVLVGLLILSSFMGGLIKVISKEGGYALYVPTTMAALVFWALGRSRKCNSELLRFAVASQAGWLIWLSVSWFSAPNIAILLDVVFLAGSSAALISLNYANFAIPYAVAFHLIGICSTAIGIAGSSGQVIVSVLTISAIFHAVPLIALVGQVLTMPHMEWNPRKIGGWQRIHVVLSIIGILGCAVWITSKGNQSVADNSGCIPISNFQRYEVAFPVDEKSKGSDSIFKISYPIDATDLEMVEAVEKAYPWLSGKSIQYLSAKQLVLNIQDVDRIKSRSCAGETLRPALTATSDYVAKVLEHEKVIFWKSVLQEVPRALAVWFYSLVTLLMINLAIFWVLKGFQNKIK